MVIHSQNFLLIKDFVSWIDGFGLLTNIDKCLELASTAHNIIFDKTIPYVTFYHDLVYILNLDSLPRYPTICVFKCPFSFLTP